jgi:hypothetical protein
MAALFTLCCVGLEEGTSARDAVNVEWAADRKRLLPGERPDTAYLEDAAHWVSVYEDLLAFNDEMMKGISQRLTLVPAGQHGAEGPDLMLLQAHVSRLRWRLVFWQRRLAELAPRDAGVAPPNGVGSARRARDRQ